MSQQARYITDLERALEGLLDCFDGGPTELYTTVENDEGVLVEAKVGPELFDAYDFAVKVMYGDEALMEDEI